MENSLKYYEVIKNNIIIKNSENKKIIFLFKGNLIFFTILFISYFIINKSNNKKSFDKKFILKIKEIFNRTYKVNLNLIEYEIKKTIEQNKKKIKSIIHIGFTLDSGYILKTMLTITSIISTQKNTTKIVLHLGVVGNFSAENMIKMYKLRKKINNFTEFNFYLLKGAMKKMKNFHKKGVACPGKFELPELISDKVERLLLFDAGDLLVFRDLTELYNYDMKKYWVLGTPEPHGIYFCYKKFKIKKFINIGSILLNIKSLKKVKFWDTYTKNRNLKIKGKPDQTLFNILVPDNKKGYFPFRFGGLSPFVNDKDSDKFNFCKRYGFKYWFNSSLSNFIPENPKNLERLVIQLYNAVFIHQFAGKWSSGGGLSIYRNLVKYFIKLADIWDEICKIKPGYCK